MKNKFLSLNRLLSVLPLLTLLIFPGKASSSTFCDNSNANYCAYNLNDIAFAGVSVYSYGVYGYSVASIGEYGYSYNSAGIKGESPNSVGVQGFGGYVGVWGENPNGQGYSAYFHGGASGTGSCSYLGGAGWNCSSDRNLKENFTPIDVEQVLQRVVQLPITRWNMKGDKKAVKHIGPMAQDFYSAFNIGDDNKLINTADIQGVALAAIQGLYKEVKEKDIKSHNQEAQIQKQEVQIQKQKTEIAQLQQQMYAMKTQFATKLARLEQTVLANNSR